MDSNPSTSKVWNIPVSEDSRTAPYHRKSYQKNTQKGEQQFMNLAQLGQLFEAAAFSGDQRQVEEAMQLLKHAHNTLGFLITMISPHISNALLNGKFAKEEIRWAYLCRINALFGTASTLSDHFPQFSQKLSVLISPSTNHFGFEPVPKELVDLVISIISTSTFLLRVADLIELQFAVCKAALTQPSTPILRLLNTLLDYNHDAVPLPLQVAQSIFWKCYDRHRSDDEFMAEVSRGRAIVSICSRPKHPAVFPMLTETGQIATPIESNNNNKETQTDEVLINGDIMIDRKIKPEPENFHDDFIPLVASGDESGDDNGTSAANNDDQLMETNVVHNNHEQRNQTKRGQKNYRSVLPRSSKDKENAKQRTSNTGYVRRGVNSNLQKEHNSRKKVQTIVLSDDEHRSVEEMMADFDPDDCYG